MRMKNLQLFDRRLRQHQHFAIQGQVLRKVQTLLWGRTRQDNIFDMETIGMLSKPTFQHHYHPIRQVFDLDLFNPSYCAFRTQSQNYLTSCVFQLQFVLFVVDRLVVVIFLIEIFLKCPNSVGL